AKLAGNALVDLKRIFTLMPKTDTGYHFGSRLLFADDGTLFITTGDRGDRPRSQALDDHAGSLIRINRDGTVPQDNPFTGQANVKPEIYTYGNRNMQGIDIHPVTRNIWTVEHGPKGGDELNLMRPGLNYGWPVITYGKNYGIGTSIGEGTEKPGMEQPVHYWVPSIATSSLLFYTGDRFPGWKHNAFVGSLRYGELARLELEGNRVVHEERLINGKVDRIREVKQGPDGLLYIITDEADGKLIRIKPAN
ncbi:MAG: PQQ-dependent sugar dehydrogenase, partial [Pirellulales bacterium]|nr:PQQ-dependent sugar dehydrogenase [Pirellulales bacterium]